MFPVSDLLPNGHRGITLPVIDKYARIGPGRIVRMLRGCRRRFVKPVFAPRIAFVSFFLAAFTQTNFLL